MRCAVTGHPTPIVTWYKNEVALNETDRVSFLPYNGTNTGQLMITRLEYVDAGNYSCLAENNIAPYHVTAYMELRIKGE